MQKSFSAAVLNLVAGSLYLTPNPIGNQQAEGMK